METVLLVKILRIEVVQKKNISCCFWYLDLLKEEDFDLLKILFPFYPRAFKYICAVCTGFKTEYLKQNQRLALQSRQRCSCNTRQLFYTGQMSQSHIWKILTSTPPFSVFHLPVLKKPIENLLPFKVCMPMPGSITWNR